MGRDLSTLSEQMFVEPYELEYLPESVGEEGLLNLSLPAVDFSWAVFSLN